MEKHELKELVQIIQYKVSVAVALSVIRSKPAGLSAKEYAEEVQEKVFQSWIKRQEPTIFDKKIVEFQQQRIFNQITDLLLPPVSTDLAEFNEIPDVCGDFVWEESCNQSSESDTDSDAAFQNNLNFVEAMVHLKFAVESSKALPADQLHSVIKGKSSSLCLTEQAHKEVIVAKNQCSEDSGFGDSGPLTKPTSKTVPSSIFRFVSHSVKTDALLKKCINSLLGSARRWILTQTKEKFSNWRGSVLEHLAAVFRNVADNPICSTSIISFITDLLDEIWKSEEIGQHAIWEYQLAMLTEFCCIEHITEAVINSIMKKMEIISQKLSNEDVYSDRKLSELYMLEQVPLFLGILPGLLKAWKDWKKDKPEAPKKTTTVTAITDLWKRNSSAGVNTSGEKNTFGEPNHPQVLENWIAVCENLVSTSSQLFPLISIQAWEILMIMNADY